MSSARLSVDVPADLWDEFCAKARAERLSPSSVMKGLIRRYVAGEIAVMSDRKFRERPAERVSDDLTDVQRAAIAATVDTLRVIASWGAEDRTPEELRTLASQVYEVDPRDICCPVCQEVICDDDCPMRGVRTNGQVAHFVPWGPNSGRWVCDRCLRWGPPAIQDCPGPAHSPAPVTLAELGP